MKYELEPDIQRPLKNPLASDQVVRTKPITTLIQYLDKEPDVYINALKTTLEQKDVE